MQVMGALLRVMPARLALDWSIRGYKVDAKKALEWGLVSKVVPEDKVDEATQQWVESILENSPKAIPLGMEAFETTLKSGVQQDYLAGMLKKSY